MLTANDIGEFNHQLFYYAGWLRDRARNGQLEEGAKQKYFEIAVAKGVPSHLRGNPTEPLNTDAISEMLDRHSDPRFAALSKVYYDIKASHKNGKRGKKNQKKNDDDCIEMNNPFDVLKEGYDCSDFRKKDPSSNDDEAKKANQKAKRVKNNNQALPQAGKLNSKPTQIQDMPVLPTTITQTTTNTANEDINMEHSGSTDTSNPTLKVTVSVKGSNQSQEEDSSDCITKGPLPKNNPPPIFIAPVPEWKKLKDEIAVHAKETPAVSLASRQIKLKFCNEQAFDLAISFLTSRKLEFHTYTIKRDRPLKIVIKGLPTTTSIAEIQNCLQDQLGNSAKVSYVRQLVSRRFKEPLPMFLTCLTNFAASEKEHIMHLHHLMDMPVRVEVYKRRGRMPMCWRCSLFFHSSENCMRTPRCAKCAGEHFTNSCVEDQPSKCCNCGGPHTAFSLECPKHPANIRKNNQKREESRKRKTKNPENLEQIPKFDVKSKKDFPNLPTSSKRKENPWKNSASIPTAKTPKEKPKSEISDFIQVVREVLHEIGEVSILEFISFMKTTLIKLKSAKSSEEKMLLLIEEGTKFFGKDTSCSLQSAEA